MKLSKAKMLYESAHATLCRDHKHDIEGLDWLNDIDTYVAHLEEMVSNLSDPEENPWED